MAAARAKVQRIIDESPVAVFSKSWCSYSRQSKAMLYDLGVGTEALRIVELDRVADGQAMQDALEELYNQTTVPNIFINKQHIGGHSDLQRQGTQRLQTLLKAAGAL